MNGRRARSNGRGSATCAFDQLSSRLFPFAGICYTQLTDVEQEQNGLLTADRKPKVDPSSLRPITELAKRR